MQLEFVDLSQNSTKTKHSEMLALYTGTALLKNTHLTAAKDLSFKGCLLLIEQFSFRVFKVVFRHGKT